MARAADDSDLVTGINVTPLVDITLVLLIIFMVTAKMVVSPSVPLALPPSNHAEAIQIIFGIDVRANGETFADGRPIGEDAELVDAAARALARDGETRAVIRADGAVPHAKVIHVLDLLHRAGVTKIAFAVSGTRE